MIVVTDKYRLRSEQTANRIVRKHIRKIIKDIPFTNMSKATYEALIIGNITKEKIDKMYLDLYTTVGEPIYNSIDKKIKRFKVFGDNLFNELINLWLQQNAGQNIISVQRNRSSVLTTFSMTQASANLVSGVWKQVNILVTDAVIGPPNSPPLVPLVVKFTNPAPSKLY